MPAHKRPAVADLEASRTAPPVRTGDPALAGEASMAASSPASASIDASSPVRSLTLSASGASAGGGVASPPVGSPGRNSSLPPVEVGNAVAPPGPPAPQDSGVPLTIAPASPGRNRQLFLASVTPQIMTCNLAQIYQRSSGRRDHHYSSFGFFFSRQEEPRSQQGIRGLGCN